MNALHIIIDILGACSLVVLVGTALWIASICIGATWEEEECNKAFDKGYADYLAGKLICPYQEDSFRCHKWHEGRLRAAREELNTQYGRMN